MKCSQQASSCSRGRCLDAARMLRRVVFSCLMSSAEGLGTVLQACKSSYHLVHACLNAI